LHLVGFKCEIDYDARIHEYQEELNFQTTNSSSMEQSPDKVLGPDLLKKFPVFSGIRVSLPHLKQPVPCSYPEPDQSNPCPRSHFLEIHLNIFLLSMP